MYWICRKWKQSANHLWWIYSCQDKINFICLIHKHKIKMISTQKVLLKWRIKAQDVIWAVFKVKKDMVHHNTAMIWRVWRALVPHRLLEIEAYQLRCDRRRITYHLTQIQMHIWQLQPIKFKKLSIKLAKARIKLNKISKLVLRLTARIRPNMLVKKCQWIGSRLSPQIF